MNATVAQVEIDVSVLIVNYNTKALTLECLKSLHAETQRIGFETILVDNASSDGSAEAIAAEFPQVQLIRSGENLGFGRGNNLAARQAKGKYVLLLNSDTVVLDRAIEKLVEFAEAKPEAQIWGGRTLFGDKSLNPTSCWRHMSIWSLFCHAIGLTTIFRSTDLFNREGYGGWDRGKIREVEFVSGCFLMMRRELWNRLGGFDERFFMYAEETDLCFRASGLGARPAITPAATIIHYGGKSEVARAGKLIKLFAGRMTFVRKHWPARRAMMAKRLMLLHCSARSAAEKVLPLLGLRQNGDKPWTSVLSKRKEWENGYPPPPLRR